MLEVKKRVFDRIKEFIGIDKFQKVNEGTYSL
jgi:hypothetical protein